MEAPRVRAPILSTALKGRDRQSELDGYWRLPPAGGSMLVTQGGTTSSRSIAVPEGRSTDATYDPAARCTRPPSIQPSCAEGRNVKVASGDVAPRLASSAEAGASGCPIMRTRTEYSPARATVTG